MVYEPNDHDDNVTPETLARSRYGTPRAGKNGSGPSRIPEQYRFKQLSAPDQASTDTEDEHTGDDDIAPESPPNVANRWRHSTNEAPPPRRNGTRPPSPGPTDGETEAGHGSRAERSSRAERRRAAESTGEAPKDDYATTHSADLSRIASFLRNTQSEQTQPAGESDPATESDPHAEAETSELPTVTPAPPSSELTSEAVLTAVRQIPGVAGARLNETDNKLALDIVEGADTDAVHRDVVAVLDSHLGVQARPPAPAVGPVEPQTTTTERVNPTHQSGRVMLERTQVITSGFESAVEVGLTVNGNRAVGRANGPAVDRHILRCAAEATVDAVGVLVGKDARVVVEYASIENNGPCRIAVVVVLLLSHDGTEQLAGAAVVDADRRQAVVHATLQALNRRLECMLAL